MKKIKGSIGDKDNKLEEAASQYFKYRDESSLTLVIECAGKLIGYFIKLYGYGHSTDDLYQVGAEGLLKALLRYNPDSGITFTTYSGHCIMGEIRHYTRKEMSYYRPRIVERLQENIESFIEKELDETGCLPEIRGIAQSLNIREDGIGEVMRAGLAPIDEIDMSKIANIRPESFRLPIEDKIALEQAFNKLSDLQRKVVYLLFYRDMTQEQAAVKLNLNQRKISRVLHSSLEAMRKIL